MQYKPVLLHIIGSQVDDLGEEEIIDLRTTGKLVTGPSSIRLIYQETALSGLEGTMTTISVEEERVTVSRTGEVEVRQVFEKGKAKPCYYVTSFGTLDLEVLASLVEVDLTEEGGNITIEYELFALTPTGEELKERGLANSKISDNRLRISVWEG